MSKWRIKGIALKGVAACVPKNVVRTEDIPLFSGKEELERFITGVGIKRRRVVEDGVCASDLCYEAAEKLIAELGWNKNEIEALIFVSVTADYRSPMTSCILQDKLGLPQSCFTIDIPSACCGYLHGLTTIASIMASGSIKMGLLLAGDTAYQMGSPEDKSRFPVFGDAGTASAFEYDETAADIISYAYADGRGHSAIIQPHSGFRHPVTPESFIMEDIAPGIRRAPVHDTLDGMEVFSFAISKAPKVLKEFLSDNSLDKDTDIDYFLIHQANLMIIERIIIKSKLDMSKVPLNISDFANTVCATIPMLMVTNINNDLKEKDLNLVLLAFGAGLTWGCVNIKTSKIICPGLIEL
jgi:3-oxoacyl-[acyl-carrier-protein] synthase-3